ncbi:MAG: hypothetical protein B6D73_08845 [gamma proteobacterium symbiont of Stewartia floridana]|nr:MAG: hypothetical protein B6D73_08845 [gamma proteobacterium symbiont of Stewartia floridana]
MCFVINRGSHPDPVLVLTGPRIIHFSAAAQLLRKAFEFRIIAGQGSTVFDGLMDLMATA